MEKSVYGEACRQWRSMRGYSQEYMARQLGLRDQKTYSRYETGVVPLDLPMLEDIAKVVGAGTVGNLLSLGEKVSFKDSPQAHAFGSNSTYHATSEKEREFVEMLIKEKDDRIRELQEEIAFLRSQWEAALRPRSA